MAGDKLTGGVRGGKRRGVRMCGAFFCALWMVLSACVVVTASPDKDAMEDPDAEYAPGELLIKFKDAASDDDKKGAKKTVDADEIKAFKGLGIGHWKLGDDWDVEKALKEFEKDKYDDIIEFAEPNYCGFVDDFPTDPMRGEQWSMHNVGQTGGTKDADMDMLEFWDSPTGTGNVIVAVIDTGVDYNHPDLDGVIWTNSGETGTDVNGNDKATNGIDDDGNTWVDDVHGYDFYNGDGDPMDDHGHGSHCAGVIAAERDNSKGVAGMSATARIMAVKWLNAGGGGNVDGAIAAVNYAASFSGDNKVKITSNSWKIGQKSRALETAIKNSGALFVSSAGNSGSSSYQYPAAYTLDNIISVAATDHNDALASFSNYGSNWVDLGAPGVSVYSCYKDGGYVWMSGTSMSAPHVAGAAALWWSNHPSDTIATTKARIMDYGDDIASLHDKTVSGKRLSVSTMFDGLSLDSDTDGPGQVSGLAVETGTQTEYSLTLTWDAVAEDATAGTGAAYAYDLRYMACAKASFVWASAQVASLEPNPKAPAGDETFTVTRLLSGTTYTFALKVIDEVGQTTGDPSNLAEGTTDTATWSVYGPIGSGAGTTYKAMAYDSSGNPGIALDMGSSLQFTYRKSDGTWSTPETVTNEGPGGMNMVYDGDTPLIVYGPGSLKFAKRGSDGTWTTTMIERNNVGWDCKDIAVSNGVIGISYRKGGLMYAEYKNGVWTKYLVDRGAACRYSAIKFDSSGQPVIAYCHYTGDNGNMLDIQKYAKRASDGTWGIETVATGVVGYGVLCDLDLDHDDTPYIACSGYSGSGSGWNFHFFTPKAGGSWTIVDVGSTYGSDTSIAIDDSGDTHIPYVGYTSSLDDNIYVSKGVVASGVWTFTREIVDPGMNANFNTILEFYYDSDGTTTTQKLGHCYGANPAVSPAPRTGGITFAERDLLNPSTWG